MAKPGDVENRFRHLRRGFVRRDRGGRGAARPARSRARRVGVPPGRHKAWLGDVT